MAIFKKKERPPRNPESDLNQVMTCEADGIPVKGLSKATIRRIINASQVLQTLTEQEVEELMREVTLVKYPTGHLLTTEGQRGDAMFAICDGEVDIYQNSSYTSTVTEGQVSLKRLSFGFWSSQKSISHD